MLSGGYSGVGHAETSTSYSFDSVFEADSFIFQHMKSIVHKQITAYYQDSVVVIKFIGLLDYYVAVDFRLDPIFWGRTPLIPGRCAWQLFIHRHSRSSRVLVLWLHPFK